MWKVGVAIIILLGALYYWANTELGATFIFEHFNSISPEVKQALNETFDKIELPANADKPFRADAKGLLLGCLDKCLTKGGTLSFIPQQECETACLCLTNGLIKASGSEFMKDNQSPEAVARNKQVTQECFAKYKH